MVCVKDHWLFAPLCTSMLARRFSIDLAPFTIIVWYWPTWVADQLNGHGQLRLEHAKLLAPVLRSLLLVNDYSSTMLGSGQVQRLIETRRTTARCVVILSGIYGRTPLTLLHVLDLGLNCRIQAQCLSTRRTFLISTVMVRMIATVTQLNALIS
jgi:hypothetical protein